MSLDNSNILKMYKPFPISIEKTSGIYVYSRDQKKYVDTFSGIGVMSFGHSYQPLISVMHEKMSLFMHVSNFFLDEDATRVADMLVGFTKKSGKVFFTNSGTEATEAALKAIKKAAAKDKCRIIHFRDGFHGRTLGALSLNGFKKLREPFEPLFENTVELEFNNIACLESYMNENGDKVVALFLEPVQGSGGVVPMNIKFAAKIMEMREKYKFIVVSDEIQSGLGRTGEVYSYQNIKIDPDIILIGKSIGGGLPLGAAIFLGETANYLKFGEHGSTFAPNPVALAGARFVLENMPPLLPEVKKKGAYLAEKLRALNSPKIRVIRGMGLMIGVLLNHDDENLRDRAFSSEQLLINVLSNKLIRLLPPLNIEYAEIDMICEKLGKVL
ncbi:MAG TPA: aminotransferase class III-fold pyridoxal phosphate-dependent enzyme [Candidatus Wallbacteria bacterium]|nr:aminotransferase class III-fold pyridoxal phosphate-dependent enzyme [Candidatus Wallbacteria bacterium]